MSMKKKYIYPQVIVSPCYGVSALCSVSGEEQQGFSGGNSGENPWESRAPRRTEVF